MPEVVSSLLHRPVYTYPQVDRLLKLSTGTARRWINGYRRGSTRHQPIIRPEARSTDWVLWGEYVEARLLAGWRDVDAVPTVKLRALADYLRRETGSEFPLAMYHTLMRPSGRTIVWRAQQHAELPENLAMLVPADEGGDVEVEVHTGQSQIVWTPVVQNFISVSEFDADDTVVRAMTADPDFPDIQLDPIRRGGEPVIRGRNIRAATIASQVRAGESSENLVDWYGLSTDEIRQAVAFDRLHARIA